MVLFHIPILKKEILKNGKASKETQKTETQTEKQSGRNRGLSYGGREL